jgi:hypothetical protein
MLRAGMVRTNLVLVPCGAANGTWASIVARRVFLQEMQGNAIQLSGPQTGAAC